jgi:hypothetical protein
MTLGRKSRPGTKAEPVGVLSNRFTPERLMSFATGARAKEKP